LAPVGRFWDRKAPEFFKTLFRGGDANHRAGHLAVTIEAAASGNDRARLQLLLFPNQRTRFQILTNEGKSLTTIRVSRCTVDVAVENNRAAVMILHDFVREDFFCLDAAAGRREFDDAAASPVVRRDIHQIADDSGRWNDSDLIL